MAKTNLETKGFVSPYGSQISLPLGEVGAGTEAETMEKHSSPVCQLTEEGTCLAV